jgi:hypothetical protein
VLEIAFLTKIGAIAVSMGVIHLPNHACQRHNTFRRHPRSEKRIRKMVQSFDGFKNAVTSLYQALSKAKRHSRISRAPGTENRKYDIN